VFRIKRLYFSKPSLALYNISENYQNPTTNDLKCAPNGALSRSFKDSSRCRILIIFGYIVEGEGWITKIQAFNPKNLKIMSYFSHYQPMVHFQGHLKIVAIAGF